MHKRVGLGVLLLSLSVSAFAQSAVTIYGRVNTTVESSKLSGDSAQNQMRNNGSNLGFLGEEDLGAGLKAGFQFERDIDSTDGASAGYEAQSEVWLGGDWGRIRLGNYGGQSFKTIVEAVSLHNDNVGTSADWLFADVMPADHHIGYVSPDIGGLVLELGYSTKDDRQAVDGTRKNAYEAIANYDWGNWSLAAAYAKYGDANQWSLRALYAMGDFLFGGYYQRDKNGLLPDAGNRNNYRFVGIYTLGANEIHLNAGYADDYSNQSGSGATQWTVAWNHNLSKRTKIYAQYTALNNRRNGLYGEDLGVHTPGQDFRSFGVGLRHYF
ncbi:porin [Lampropedia puyangensis]|uniref:Porin n=1 Tax=Lampropedia puyangensis TaxID=1330072 RepID=A0A4S8EUV3_9BURK|nr:porin [Lampropedia puyangensis]THT98667.1 porin [Lampropedia puyangensis]